MKVMRANEAVLRLAKVAQRLLAPRTQVINPAAFALCAAKHVLRHWRGSSLTTRFEIPMLLLSYNLNRVVGATNLMTRMLVILV